MGCHRLTWSDSWGQESDAFIPAMAESWSSATAPQSELPQRPGVITRAPGVSSYWLQLDPCTFPINSSPSFGRLV